MGWDGSRGPTNPKYRDPAHVKARAAMVKAYRPGDPCARCGHPMWPPTSTLHADHDDSDPTGRTYLGLSHGSQPCQDCGVRCNVSAGAERGRAMQTRATSWDL